MEDSMWVMKQEIFSEEKREKWGSLRLSIIFTKDLSFLPFFLPSLHSSWWYCGLDSGPYTCTAGALPLASLQQPFSL
jgi:hypothetical protein